MERCSNAGGRPVHRDCALPAFDNERGSGAGDYAAGLQDAAPQLAHRVRLMPESSGEKTGAKVRCFVAIDTPAELKERVSALIARMRGMEGGRKVRWVKPDG